MAAEIWMEARRLYMGTTATNWTLTITTLVSTHYTDGEDVLAHITKMKSYCRDLLLMQHNIDNELFACFLRISMPSSWNYIFAALPEHYMSAEVEQRIRDEYGVCTSQGANTSLQAVRPKRKPCPPIPGQPYCDNCKIPGHWTKDCYSPSGMMHGKPHESKSKKEEGTKDAKSKNESKGKYKAKPRWANQAVTEDNEHESDQKYSDSDVSAYLAASTISHSHFGWILDSGSTNHICTERSAFIVFTPTNGIIKGIVKNGPMLQVLGIGTVLITVSVKAELIVQ